MLTLPATRTLKLIVAAVIVAAAGTTTGHAQTASKMKMTTDIPANITTPDSVETRLGTLKFTDGFPDDSTVHKRHEIISRTVALLVIKWHWRAPIFKVVFFARPTVTYFDSRARHRAGEVTKLNQNL